MGFSTRFRLILLGYLTLGLGSILNKHWSSQIKFEYKQLACIHYCPRTILYVLKARISFSWPHSHYEAQCSIIIRIVLNLN